MSPEAQRIAIAEVCGWTDIQVERNTLTGRQPDMIGACACEVPDYLNDLNAMHAAEQWAIEDGMDADQWDQYGKHLESIHPTAVVRSWEDVEYFDLALVAHCTAAQRAEAFLRTLGRWTEESK